MPDTVIVKVIETPNPKAMKFAVSKVLLADSKTNATKATFVDIKEAKDIELVKNIFNFPNIVQVHISKNSLTVTQNGLSQWSSLAKIIEKSILASISNHNPDFVPPASAKELKKRKSQEYRDALEGELDAIDKILDSTVRPALQADGGDLQVVDYIDNILTIRYEGACGGCPSSMYGTLAAITNTLRQEYNTAIEVCVV